MNISVNIFFQNIDIMDKPLYQPFVSKAKDKKYSVYVMRDGGKKLIHFGQKNMQHYKDNVLGVYKNLDHGDKERRRLYRARASKIRDKAGNLTVNDKNTANYWAYHGLW